VVASSDKSTLADFLPLIPETDGKSRENPRNPRLAFRVTEITSEGYEHHLTPVEIADKLYPQTWKRYRRRR